MNKRSKSQVAQFLAVSLLIVSVLVTITQLPSVIASATEITAQFGTPVTIAPDNSGGGQLIDLSCPTATMCAAVGGNNAVTTQSIYSIGTEGASGWSWSNLTDVSPDSSGGGTLYGISCPTTNLCLAVGADDADDTQSIYTVGTDTQSGWSWSASDVVAPDSSGGGSLEDVSCPNSTTCVAVGLDSDAQAIYSIGTGTDNDWTWSTASPIGSDDTGFGFLTSVDCSTATNCVAVGGDATQEIYSVGTESGDGWTWSTSATIPSDSSGGGVLSAVSCVTAGSCVAVGQDDAVEGQAVVSVGTDVGGTWTWSTSEKISSDSSGGGELFGVSCVSAESCIAVGEDQNYQQIFATGSETSGDWSWSASTVAPSDASRGGGFNAVDCSSSVSCVAVGIDNSSNAMFDTLANLIVPTDVLGVPQITPSEYGTGLKDVSCPSAVECVAVGSDEEPVYSVGSELGGSWTWSTATIPAPEQMGETILAGVDCPSTSVCVAVGNDDSGQPIFTVGSDTVNGWTWSTPAVTASGEQVLLYGLSCASAVECVAVGSVVSDSTQESIYETATVSDGTWEWSTPVAVPLSLSTFFSVSCATTTTCVGVGEANATPDSGVAFVPAYSSGTQTGGAWTWSTPVEITPNGSVEGSFNGIDCIESDLCFAVGSASQELGGDGQAFVLEGTESSGVWTWSTPSGFSPGSEVGTQFNGVSCPSSTYCVAVGSQGSEPAYSIGIESGNVWSWTASSVVPDEGIYASVSCADDTSCVAIGGGGNALYDAWTPTIPALPDSPLIGSATLASSTVTVNWSTPSNTSNYPIVGYDVLAVDSSTSTISYDVCPSSFTSTSTSCVPTGLEPGDDYTFSAAAVTDEGIGPISNYTNSVALPATAPSSPTIGLAAAGDASATVAWNAPAEDGGEPLLGYEVAETNETTSITVFNVCPGTESSVSTSCVVTGLINGDTYDFAVAAINTVGTGEYSSVSNVVVPTSPGSGGGGGSGSGGGGGGGGVTTTPPPSPPPSSPPSSTATSPPIPRELTYSGDESSLSPRATLILITLIKKLEPGASIVITGYARHDPSLARKRAEVVAQYLKRRIAVHVTVKISTISKVAKVIVTTSKQ